jgi:hypothetical protein
MITAKYAGGSAVRRNKTHEKQVHTDKWYRLDNAAKLYPAIQKADWNSVYRITATLSEIIDPQTLQNALERVIKRFDNMRLRLHHGIFWYYLKKTARSRL